LAKAKQKGKNLMCGIVGAVAERNIEKILLEGLKRLEYRGYDSAGIAVISPTQKLLRVRSMGKVAKLEESLIQTRLHGHTGIAHTRWATHGAPSEQNAHPLTSSNEIALVHNGIIENHQALRQTLLSLGYNFSSETDTETVVHLLHYFYQQCGDLMQATQMAVAKLEGAYALGIISIKNPQHLIAVRHGSPLVLGKGIGENFIASDPMALFPVTQQFIYLEDNDIAELTREKITIYADGTEVQRTLHTIENSGDTVERGEYRHYMNKEIAEQPQAISACLENRIAKSRILESAFGPDAQSIFNNVLHVQLIACGTSFHAALVARYWLESIAEISCTVEVASEYRYRKFIVSPNSLFVCLSQSGETADTLAALRLAKKMGYLSTLAICNVAESSLVRESELNFLTRAGTEIGVASTKAFTTQLTALFMLTLVLGSTQGLSLEKEKYYVQQLENLPRIVEKTLSLSPQIKDLAANFSDKEHALFLGRGALYPIALEGALKLKEISYIHAEGYPAGELKHGPLALVDKNMPVIALVPNDELLEKLKSNLSEVRARGGELYVFTDSATNVPEESDVHVISMPEIDSALSPILYTIPLQLFAYHVAVLKGTDVDQPRNLAKSVTVE
jgi:glucosamine--fructose-6-phosphate aminotransferase (isomerizing)